MPIQNFPPTMNRTVSAFRGYQGAQTPNQLPIIGEGGDSGPVGPVRTIDPIAPPAQTPALAGFSSSPLLWILLVGLAVWFLTKRK